MALWTPPELPSIMRYYKAQAITGLSNTDPISTFIDSSGNSQSATQSGSARPTYRTGVINGLPVVRCAGSQTMAMPAASLIRNVGGCTMFSLIKDSAITTRGAVMHVGVSSTGNTRFNIESGSFGGNNAKYGSGGRRLDSDSFSGIFSTQNVAADWTIFIAVADYQGRIVRQYVNGVLDGEDTTWLTAGNTSNTESTASTSTIFGTSNALNSNTFQGDCLEIGLTNAAASTEDRQRIEGYLAHTADLTSLLPSDHPYKTAPPGFIPSRRRRELSGGLL